MQARLDEARKQVAEDLLARGQVKDATDWLLLAPPSDDVSGVYLQSNSDLRPLACARALLSASEESKQSGGLYPFEIGAHKTNGLLTAVGWICDKYSARSVALQLCTSSESVNFAHERSPCWHVLSLHSLLKQFPGLSPEAYKVAVQAAAHAMCSNNPALQECLMRLARACFILWCPRLASPPSMEMETEVFLALTEGASKRDELNQCMPKIVDDEIGRAKKKHARPVCDNALHSRLHALCDLYQVPDSLSISV